MFTFEAENAILSSPRQRLWNTKREKSLKNSFFDVYCLLYHNSSLEDYSSFRQKVKEAIECIIWCFQIMSLLWVPNLSLKHWSEHNTIWEIIGYLRFDIIFSEFEMIEACLYLSIFSTFTIFAGTLVLVFTIYYSVSLPKKIFGLFTQIFDFWANAILVPSTVLFCIFIKYNIISQTNISEYRNYNDYSELKINTPLQCAVFFGEIINFLLILLHTEFSGEIRHSVSSQILKAKAHSKINFHLSMFTYFSPVLYVCLNSNYMIYFQTFVMIISVIMIIESMEFLPYFSIYFNLSQILRIYAILMVSFGFFLGFWMDNSLVIILVAIILGPLAAAIIIHITLKLQKNFYLIFQKNRSNLLIIFSN